MIKNKLFQILGIGLILVSFIHIILFVSYYVKNDLHISITNINVLIIAIEIILGIIFIFIDTIKDIADKSSKKKKEKIIKVARVIGIILLVIVAYTFIKYNQTLKTTLEWLEHPEETQVTIENENMYYAIDNMKYNIGQKLRSIDIKDTTDDIDNTLDLVLNVDDRIVKKIYICFNNANICLRGYDKVYYDDNAYKLGDKIFKSNECDSGEDKVICRNDKYQVTIYNNGQIEATNYKKKCYIENKYSYCTK